MDEQLTPRKPRVSDTSIELQRQFSFFATFWAFASLLVAWQRRELAMESAVSAVIHCGIGVTAFAVLVRPAWTIPFLLLSLLHVAHGLVEMPLLTSTDLMWLFFGATVCASSIMDWVVHRSYRIGAVDLYRGFAPCLRIMLVTSLAAICLARLNWSFLHLESSLVVTTLAHVRGDQMLPEWVAYLTISMLLVVDLFLAFALLVPSLRRFVVGFGSCYFAWQAVIGFGESRLMLPLLIVGLCLFITPDLLGRIHSAVARWIPIPTVRSWGISVITAVVVMIVAALWFQNADTPAGQFLTAERVCGWFYVGLVGVWFVVLLPGLVDERPRMTSVSFLVRNPIHYVLVALLVMAAASPYFGFGSLGKFVEFSGLSTAGDGNNHLLFPQADLAGYEQDLVEIIVSNDPYLESLAEQGKLITWIEFVNYTQPRPETAVTFLRGNERFAVERAGDITELSTKNPWVVRKFFKFGLVDKDAVSHQTQQVAAQKSSD